jgi:hypothetical protein
MNEQIMLIEYAHYNRLTSTMFSHLTCPTRRLKNLTLNNFAVQRRSRDRGPLNVSRHGFIAGGATHHINSQKNYLWLGISKYNVQKNNQMRDVTDKCAFVPTCICLSHSAFVRHITWMFVDVSFLIFNNDLSHHAVTF